MVKEISTVYKHWLPWLWALKRGRQPEKWMDTAGAVRLGLISEGEDGVYLTPLGEKVLRTAELMEELKAQGVKLSW